MLSLAFFSVVFFGFYPLGVSLVSKVQVYMESSRAKLMKFIETAFGHRVLVEISAFSCIPSFADQGSIWRIRSLFTEKKNYCIGGFKSWISIYNYQCCNVILHKF